MPTWVSGVLNIRSPRAARADAWAYWSDLRNHSSWVVLDGRRPDLCVSVLGYLVVWLGGHSAEKVVALRQVLNAERNPVRRRETRLVELIDGEGTKEPLRRRLRVIRGCGGAGGEC
jgi:hypothetical protein